MPLILVRNFDTYLLIIKSYFLVSVDLSVAFDSISNISLILSEFSSGFVDTFTHFFMAP